MKKMLLLIAVVAFLAAGNLNALADDHQGPDEVTYETTIGTISFLHIKHQGKISDCTECHHKGIEEGKCTGCHTLDGKEGIPKAKTAFHGQCKGCHKISSGPTRCKDCHIKG